MNTQTAHQAFNSLVDSILNSIQSVNQALSTYVYLPAPKAECTVAPTIDAPVMPAVHIEERIPLRPPVKAPRVAPVLTIPIAELQKARALKTKSSYTQRTRRARRERNDRHVEVVYRKGFRMVS